jgi:hypothetical protein
MERDELELFERSIRHATEQRTGAELDHALAELGWTEALAADPRAAVATLFDLQGRATTTSGALDLVLADALGPAAATATGATGAARATDAEANALAVVLPAMGGWAPPGSLAASGTLDVQGLATAGLADRTTALVVATTDAGEALALLPVGSLTLRTIEGVDPGAGLLAVTGTAIPTSAPTALPADAWTVAVARGRLALAHELVGASRTMLALAREHALERVQFGQPISSFQAIRHRLAETLVAIETAEAAIDAAWLDGSPVAAAMAKALAGRSARTVIRHCQQVLAGIGFTTEHPLHLSIRRALVLDALLGTSVAITRAMGDDLVATRRLPPLLPL